MHLFRHAGLDPASRRSWKYWIPAFAGMTTFMKTVVYGQTLIRIVSLFNTFQVEVRSVTEISKALKLTRSWGILKNSKSLRHPAW